MIELFYPQADREAPEQLLLATVGSVNASGTTLAFNGGTASTTRYKRVQNGQTIAAGDVVLVARISGSYVILGKIGY